jgi:hypothetical protein
MLFRGRHNSFCADEEVVRHLGLAGQSGLFSLLPPWDNGAAHTNDSP